MTRAKYRPSPGGTSIKYIGRKAPNMQRAERGIGPGAIAVGGLLRLSLYLKDSCRYITCT